MPGDSTRYSAESGNIFVGAPTLYEGEGYESEYVGDSEFTENELGEDDDIVADYPSSAEFQASETIYLFTPSNC